VSNKLFDHAEAMLNCLYAHFCIFVIVSHKPDMMCIKLQLLLAVQTIFQKQNNHFTISGVSLLRSKSTLKAARQ